jgi:LCP family protein required for cell wall assembly
MFNLTDCRKTDLFAMKTKRTLPNVKRLFFVFTTCFLSLSFLLSACAPKGRPGDGQPNAIHVWNDVLSSSPTETPMPTDTPTPWPTFAPAPKDMATPAPSPAKRAELPEGSTIWLILGAEEEKPLRGRTNAIHLVLVNERLSKASIISIPGSVYLYLPGQGMGRFNTAYPLGGMKLVYETLGYNFGLWPDRYVLAHETEFSWLVNDLDQLEVSVLFPIRDDCGGLPAGLHRMDGSKVLCYVSYGGDDDVYRTERQQQVLQLLFTKLVQWGRLARLPVFYASYIEKLDTDISLMDLVLRIPLALRLGDPNRVKSFILGWESLDEWQLPDLTPTKLLLPREGKIELMVEQAIKAISKPAALNAVVLTYEWQLTDALGQTATISADRTQAALPPIDYAVEETIEASPTIETIESPVPVGTPTSTPVRSQTPTPTRAAPTPYPTSGPYPFPTVIWDTPAPGYP